MKFKRFSVLLIILLTLSTVFSSVVSAKENRKQNLVALGDSITYGYNLGDNSKPSPQAFPSLIAHDRFNVTNLGMPGGTSSDLLLALKNPIFISAIKSADVVTLDIGSNDLLQAAGISLSNPQPVTVTPELLERLKAAGQNLGLNLQAIIATIKQMNNDATIILYNIYNPFGESNDPFLGSLHTLGEQIIPVVNSQVIRPIAQHTGSLLADAYTAFDGNQSKYIIPGDIHPTVNGHRALAKLAQDLLDLKHSKGDDYKEHHSKHAS